MLYELLVLSSLWFWPALIIPTIALLALVENYKYFWANLVLFLTVVAFILLGDKHWGEWLIHNPVEVAKYVGGYVGIGIVWAVLKWTLLVRRYREIYDDLRAEYKKRGALDALFDKNEFAAFLRSNSTHRIGDFPPNIADYKGKIIFWMAYWPWSGFWTIINDPIRRFYNLLYRLIGGALQAISQAQFGKYKGDL